jgi:peptidoglycan/LPS O-acetylase OafA/YrhL
MAYPLIDTAPRNNSVRPLQQQARETTRPSAEGGRVDELDSLRGIAALTVVFHHCLVVFPALWALYETRHIPASPVLAMLAYSPLHLLWGGVEAVNVFFVLSGLVLAFPFFGANRPRYGHFVLKRMVRIYVPYFVVMAAALLLMDALLPLGHPQASSWFQQYWGHPADGAMLRDYLFMLGEPVENIVNPVIWSLVHEVRISLVFPILMWLVRWRRPGELLFASLLFSLGAKFVLHAVGGAHGWSTIVDTCQYVFFFVAGAEIAAHRAWLTAIYNGMSVALKVTAVTGSLLLLNARWELPGSMREVSALCMWAGAVFIVALTFASAREASLLRRAPFVWLGRISYSLYLTHCLVLFSALFLLHSYLPAPVIVAFVPLISLCVAAGVYRVVEFPSLSLAKRLSPRRPWRRNVSTAA